MFDVRITSLLHPEYYNNTVKLKTCLILVTNRNKTKVEFAVYVELSDFF